MNKTKQTKKTPTKQNPQTNKKTNKIPPKPQTNHHQQQQNPKNKQQKKRLRCLPVSFFFIDRITNNKQMLENCLKLTKS